MNFLINISVLLSVLFISACSSKYVIIPTIEKKSFKLSEKFSHNPITKKLKPGKEDTQWLCYGQFLWFSNSQTRIKNSVPNILHHTCKNKEYLLNAKLTETWWTTILYTRSCIEITAKCADTY
jgi:hypothetical protein